MTAQASGNADFALSKCVVETRTYRNEVLGKWIDAHALDEGEKVIAWQMAFHIADMYPEVKEKIRGELIDFETQEEIWESQ